VYFDVFANYGGEKLLWGIAFLHTTQDKMKTLTSDMKLGKLNIVVV
jgi:hypothetical protein